MSGKIYLIQSNNALQALSQQSYPNEDLFQGLLEQYPALLAGDQSAETKATIELRTARDSEWYKSFRRQFDLMRASCRVEKQSEPTDEYHQGVIH